MLIVLASLTVVIVVGVALLVPRRYVNARERGALWTVRLGLPYAFFSYDAPVRVPSSSSEIEVVTQEGRTVVRDAERSGLARWLHRGSLRVPVAGVLSADRHRLVVWAQFGMVARLVVGALLTAAAFSVIARDLSGPEGLDGVIALLAVVFAGGTARVLATMVRRARAYASHLVAAGPGSPVVPASPRPGARPGTAGRGAVSQLRPSPLMSRPGSATTASSSSRRGTLIESERRRPTASLDRPLR